jgi:Ca2+-binding EF-hand superfamily protein
MGEKKKKEKKEKKEEEKPAEEAPPAEEAAAAPPPKKKSVNVMAMFNQTQIQEFKEAFTMMDQDRDGIINEDDLANIYQQVGLDAKPKQLNPMDKADEGQINFTGFPGVVWNRS